MYQIRLVSFGNLSENEATYAPVRKAAKLAVYDDIMMSVKNHQMPATMRVEMALKHKSTSAEKRKSTEKNYQKYRKRCFIFYFSLTSAKCPFPVAAARRS